MAGMRVHFQARPFGLLYCRISMEESVSCSICKCVLELGNAYFGRLCAKSSMS